MEIKLEYSGEADAAEFLDYFLEAVKDVLRSSIEPDKIKARDEKLNSVAHLSNQKRISALSVIRVAIEDLSWTQVSPNQYVIAMSRTKKLYGSADTLYVLAKLIEYGTTGLPPLNFFRPIFKDFAQSVQTYYDVWKECL